MSRRGDFVSAVQTLLVLRHEMPAAAVPALRGAFALPEHAIPEDAAGAALEWVAYANGGDKPGWYAEHQEQEAAGGWCLVGEVPRGFDDHPSPAAREWWGHVADVCSAEAVPPSVLPFVEGNTREVLVTKQDADAFVDWAATIPGWDYDDPPFVVVPRGR